MKSGHPFMSTLPKPNPSVLILKLPLRIVSITPF